MCSAWGPSRGPAAPPWNPPVSLAGMTFPRRPCLALELWVLCVCACWGGGGHQDSHHNVRFPLGPLVTPASLFTSPSCGLHAAATRPSQRFKPIPAGPFLLPNALSPDFLWLPPAVIHARSRVISAEGLLGSPLSGRPSRQGSAPSGVLIAFPTIGVMTFMDLLSVPSFPCLPSPSRYTLKRLPGLIA